MRKFVVAAAFAAALTATPAAANVTCYGELSAGKNVTARIKRVPDPTIISIVSGWPRDFATERALKLGFTTAEKTFDDIIRIHIEDELGGKFAA